MEMNLRKKRKKKYFITIAPFFHSHQDCVSTHPAPIELFKGVPFSLQAKVWDSSVGPPGANDLQPITFQFKETNLLGTNPPLRPGNVNLGDKLVAFEPIYA